MPEARRHFIDRGVASLRPAYVQTVSDYNRVIKQKNRILQDALSGKLVWKRRRICWRPGTINWPDWEPKFTKPESTTRRN